MLFLVVLKQAWIYLQECRNSVDFAVVAALLPTIGDRRVRIFRKNRIHWFDVLEFTDLMSLYERIPQPDTDVLGKGFRMHMLRMPTFASVWHTHRAMRGSRDSAASALIGIIIFLVVFWAYGCSAPRNCPSKRTLSCCPKKSKADDSSGEVHVLLNTSLRTTDIRAWWVCWRWVMFTCDMYLL